MGPGARPLQPGENGGGSMFQEIMQIRSKYSIHLGTDAVDLAYELKGQNRAFHIPFDKVPIGSWTRSLCYGGPNAAAATGTLVIDLIRGCENMSGRRVTQDEAEGMTFYGSRRQLTLYIGQAAAVGLGGLNAWLGRSQMKFPFVKPKPIEQYDAFPLRQLPILKGWYARTMWTITRYNVYIGLWILLTQPFVRSIADTRMTVGLYQDRRTHDLSQVLKGQFDRLRGNRTGQGAVNMQGQQSSQRGQEQDDASSQTFYDEQSYGNDNSMAADSSFTDGNTDTGLITDGAMQQRQTTQASPNAWSKAQSRGSRTAYEQPQSARSEASRDIFFDDASPTPGNDPEMGNPQAYTTPAGSAWSRIRKGEASTPGQTSTARTSESRDFETKTDSFSFSDREEDKVLAKQQAQKEFDAMLDKERKEGGAADYARDMQATNAAEEGSTGSDSAWSRYRRR